MGLSEKLRVLIWKDAIEILCTKNPIFTHLRGDPRYTDGTYPDWKNIYRRQWELEGPR